MCRPAFGRAVFGTGAETNQARRTREPKAGNQTIPLRGFDAKSWIGQRAFERGAARRSQIGKSLHHQRQGALVELARIGQQQVSGFANEADALRNACEQRHQCRLEGIRQHVGAVVIAGPHDPAGLQAFAQRKLAVRERTFDGLADFRHAPEDRQRPAGAEYIDRRRGVALLQKREQGLRQQRIAYPGWRHDQDSGHGCKGKFSPQRRGDAEETQRKTGISKESECGLG